MLIVGLIFGWYETKINEAKKEALAAFNAAQMTEVIKEKDALASQLKTLQDQTTALQTENQQLNDQVKADADATLALINKSKDTQLDPLFVIMLNSLNRSKK